MALSKVVVTGGSGRVGRYVLRELRDHYDVINADLSASAEAEFVATDVMQLDAVRAAEAFVELFAEVKRPRVVLAYADEMPPYFEPFRHEVLEKWQRPDPVKDEIEAMGIPVHVVGDAGGPAFMPNAIATGPLAARHI